MTGTFDDWAKSVKLDRNGETFEKRVDLPESVDKVYYKVGAKSRNAPGCHVINVELAFQLRLLPGCLTRY